MISRAVPNDAEIKVKFNVIHSFVSFHSVWPPIAAACVSLSAADALAGCCGWFGLCKLNRQIAVSVCFNIVSGGSMVSDGGGGGGNRGGKSIPRIIILTLCRPPAAHAMSSMRNMCDRNLFVC